MKIACQTITFGEEMNLDNMPKVLETVAKAGFKGVEIGVRRLAKEPPEFYAELLKKNGLELIAIHIGGNFLDAASVARQMNEIPTVINRCKVMDSKYVFLSGAYCVEKPTDDYKIEAENYNKLGKVLKDEGLTLCYHNHAWEIKNDALGLRTLAEYTDPEFMSFVPDVGWVTVGGVDPVVALKILNNRVRNVHFKEFTKEKKFAELGNGIVNFEAVANEIKNLKNVEWVVAEQDKSEIGPEASITSNFKFISNLF
jgi:sugar phosphate isomerase/epimerase